ncbi:SGNH/GDSL hydrolase family protein [Gordonia sp. VNK21]|uniref:SGNH/GDSL hydrolase family protein n=1 Tax=Gordonia sp. VNK21 TaxID=3382483 RepID=UPI0038D35F71
MRISVSRGRGRVRVAGAVLAAAALVGGAVAAPAQVQARPAVNYVNLGDSFSAASGVSPQVPGGSPNCSQSQRNTAHVIAAKYRYRLTDVSCGGAKTEDFFHPQAGTSKPQLAALNDRTDLVTFMIGGNDGDMFATAIAECTALGVLSGQRGNPCERQAGAKLIKLVRTQTYPDLVKAMRAVRAAAPNARVAVLNYPMIVGDDTRPCPAMVASPGDKPFIHRLQTELNDAVARAAAETGVEVVDVAAASKGHDACTPEGVRWVEPTLTTVQPVPLHPNALGAAKMAAVAGQALRLS